MKKNVAPMFMVASAVLFLARVIVFAGHYGGVEHDSGWYVGVARNLAERGIYASYTNTITYEKEGSYPSLHGRYSVQDNQGYSYFPAGVTVGPGYIIPQALLMKLFGYGFWAMRLWPLTAFFGMLLLLFYFAYRLGGWVSLTLFTVWLWIYPQIFIPGAYEALGEHIALFYLLLSFYFFIKKTNSRRKYLLMLVSGIAFSLAVLTKYLTLLAGASFAIVFLYDLFLALRGSAGKEKILSWLFWITGFILPIVLFEGYRYISLVSQFGVEGWRAVNKDFELHFKSNGSGASLSGLDPDFIKRKFLVWSKVGFKYGWVPWLLLAASITDAWTRVSERKRKVWLFILLFASTFSGLLWFVILSPTGWTRHAWLSLVLGLVLIFGLAGNLFMGFHGRNKSIYLFFAFLFLVFSYRRDIYHPQYLFSEPVIEKWEESRYEGNIQGLPANPIISPQDQAQVQKFFRENVNSNDRVYYLGWFLVAEVSPLADKVFYTYDRYEYLDRKNPDGGLSYLIIGPYQKGKHSLVSPTYYIDKIDKLCKQVVLNNPSYTLCTLRDDVVYTNNAYE